MGLDGVELVLALEEEFGIELPDNNAAKMRTPQDVIEFITPKLATAKAGVCPSQHAFYKLRRVLCAQTGQPRKTITPATPLADLLPADMRDPAWQKLRDAVQPEKWPAPVRSPGLVRALTNAVCLGAIVVSFVVVPGPWTQLTDDSFGAALADDLGGLMGARLVVLFVAACVLAAIAVRATCSMRRYLPAKIQRAGDLAKLVRERAPEGALPREKVAAKVRDIVIEQLGIKPETYREDADFVKDFGMG